MKGGIRGSSSYDRTVMWKKQSNEIKFPRRNSVVVRIGIFLGRRDSCLMYIWCSCLHFLGAQFCSFLRKTYGKGILFSRTIVIGVYIAFFSKFAPCVPESSSPWTNYPTSSRPVYKTNSSLRTPSTQRGELSCLFGPLTNGFSWNSIPRGSTWTLILPIW